MIIGVNVFEAEPLNLDALLAVRHAGAQLLREQPDFGSLWLFGAVSGGAPVQLVGVHEWDSINALRAATCQGSFQEGARRVVDELGVIAHPRVYDVALKVEAP